MDQSNILFNFIQTALTADEDAIDNHDSSASLLASDSTEQAFVPQTPAAGAQVQQNRDVQMDTGEDDDMPALQDISDSSDSESEDESDRDAHEVEMQAVDDNDDIPRPFGPSQASSSSNDPSDSSRTNSNRRARVDDDDDTERDRRHPSERVSSATPSASSSSASGLLSPSAHLHHNHTHTPASSSTSTPSAQQAPPRTPAHTAQHQHQHQHHIFHATVNMSGRGGAPNATPFHLFQQMMANANSATNNNPNANPAATNNDNNAGLPHPQPQQPPQARHFAGEEGGVLFGGMAVSFDLGSGIEGGIHLPFPVSRPPPAPRPEAPQGDNANSNANTQPRGPPNQPPAPNSLGDLFASIGLSVNQMMAGGAGPGGIPININLGAFGLGLGMENEKEDPERAKKLVEGLEDVSVGLVRRLVRVGGTGGGMGEDETKGGDAGCAICWDSLLDAEGDGFGKQETVVVGSETTSIEAGSSSSAAVEAEPKQPRIISLPCAHVFHADCLIPWFSRPKQTTCPTCRFNIDPDNLTYVSWRRRERARQEAEAAARAADPNAPQEGAPVQAPDANENPIPGIPFGAGIPLNHDMLPGLADGQRITMDMFLEAPGFLGPRTAPSNAPPPDALPNVPENRPAHEDDEEEDDVADQDIRAALEQESEQHLRTLGDILGMFRNGGPAPRAPGTDPNPDDANVANDEQPQQPQQPPTAASRPQPQPARHGTQLPPFLPNLFNAGNGIHFASGSGRTFREAFSQLFAGIPFPQPPQGQPGDQVPQPQTQAPPVALEEQEGDTVAEPTPVPNAQPQTQPFPPPVNPFGRGLPPLRMFPQFADLFGSRPEQPDLPKKAWAVPPAPGPTLRQRIERREREAGLRCYDISCGVGPSDEDPELCETVASIKQLSIKGADGAEVCSHRFHSACLVSAERVAMGGVDLVIQNGAVEVSCPVCRGVGSVTKVEWDEGVVALE